MPKVAVIATGGTIGSLADHPREVLDYGHRPDLRLRCEDLLGRFPELGEIAELVPVHFRSVPSFNIFFPEWLDILELMDRLVAETAGLDGIVLLHGTGSLEETAYFLSLTVRVACPVVVIGAQRPPSAWSSDAAMNLADAIRVACAPNCRDLGVVVVMNDEIHAPRDVTKVSTLRLDTFTSPDTGPLGFVDGDTIALYRRPLRRRAPRHRFDITGRLALPRVDIVYSYAGADGTAARAFIDAGAVGIVSAGFPPGYTGDAEAAVLAAAVRDRGLVVVQASRGGAGRTFASRRARDNGFVPADDLNPQKARILLALALTRTRSPAEVAAMFATY